MSAATDFRAAIEASLGQAPDHIEPGRLTRFSTNGRRSDLSGWCRPFEDGTGGVYGCFRQGVSEVWSAQNQQAMTPAERAELRRKVAQARAEREREQADAWRKNADRIAYLWRQSRPVVDGDPVHRYLCRRLAVGDLAAPSCIRFHPQMPYVHASEPAGEHPAMVAPLLTAAGRVVALHRTYLDTRGRKAEVPGAVKKLTPASGLLTGTAIRLAVAAAGTVGISEGIETSMAATMASGVPVWSAYCSNGVATWQWPAGTRRIVVFADADEPGRLAAAKLQERAQRARVLCEVRSPTAEGADWCDVWANRSTAEVPA